MKKKFKAWLPSIKVFIRKAFTDNLSLKMISVLLTLTLFALVAGESVQISKRVNIEYLTPENMMIVNTIPFEFEIVLSGQKTQIGMIRGQNYYYKVNLMGAGVGTSRVRLDTRELGLPRGVVVSSILPSRIYPKLENVITKKVPVELKYDATEFKQRHIKSITADPSEIEISGPESNVSLIKKIATENIDLKGFKKSKAIKVNLLPLNTKIKILNLESDKVNVQVDIIKQK